MIFGSRLVRSPGFRVTVGDTAVTAKNCVKYLGCELDRFLTGECTGHNVIVKVYQKVTSLARKATFLDEEP